MVAMLKLFLCGALCFLVGCSSTVDYAKHTGTTLSEYEKFYNLSAYQSEWEINPPPDATYLEVTYFLDKGNLFLSVVDNPEQDDAPEDGSKNWLVKKAIFLKSDISKEERYKAYRKAYQKYIERYKK